MVRVVLVRPGCTDYDQQGRIQGTLDLPLCEQGRQEVAHLSEELKNAKLSMIYCAPCRSALESAKLLGTKLGVKVKPIEKLINLDHGLWQGMLVEEVKNKQPRVYRQWQEHPETVCPPNGELVEEAQTRMAEALYKILRKHNDCAIAILVSEPMATLLKATLLQQEVGNLWEHLSDGARCETLDVLPEELAHVS